MPYTNTSSRHSNNFFRNQVNPRFKTEYQPKARGFTVQSFQEALDLYLSDQTQENRGRLWQKRSLVKDLKRLSDEYAQAENAETGRVLLNALTEAEGTLGSWWLAALTVGEQMMKAWKTSLAETLNHQPDYDRISGYQNAG